MKIVGQVGDVESIDGDAALVEVLAVIAKKHVENVKDVYAIRRKFNDSKEIISTF